MSGMTIIMTGMTERTEIMTGGLTEIMTGMPERTFLLNK